MASTNSVFFPFPSTTAEAAAAAAAAAEAEAEAPSPLIRRAPHLPFRRISLPAVPSQAAIAAHARARAVEASTSSNRFSIASIQQQQQQQLVSHKLLDPGPKQRRTASRPSSLAIPPQRPQRPTAVEHKRTQVIREILDSERSYVDGLDLIYDLFLEPLIRALEQPRPLLSRNQLNIVFSNFIEIWNFHKSFYAAFYNLLAPSFSSQHQRLSASAAIPNFMGSPPSGVADLLSQHFPYLNLYHPFVTAYPTVIATLDNFTSPLSVSYSQPFAEFIKAQQQNPRCRPFGLRDWLLTLIQRCPRYELLLRDLILHTDSSDPEYQALEKVLILVTKINTSLNSALQTQTLTLTLVAIQRATPNLPFTFIEPGRSFIRRGSLLQIGDRLERVREFFLFSDCLVWLSRGGDWEGIAGRREEFFLRSAGSSSPSSASGLNVFGGRIRKTSEVDIGTPLFRRSASSSFAFPSGNPRYSGVEEERWWFRGRTDLMDLEVVVPHLVGLESGEEGRFDILNPEMSFALYAESVEERDAWTLAIRTAKESRLVALNVTNRDSTLTSSSSTQHLRRALQALPYPPDDDRDDEPSSKKKRKDHQKDKNRERRGRVEHFVPAIWVPDAKAESCMRCGGVFGWRRRRHHCRLCGRCVCASCSSKTFFITETPGSNKKVSPKPARACNACYEAVFPVLDGNESTDDSPANGHIPHYSSIGTLTALPASRSMPSLLLNMPVTTGNVASASPLEYSFPIVVPRTGADGTKERPKSGIDLMSFARPSVQTGPGSATRPPSLSRLSSYTTSTATSAVTPTGDVHGEMVGSVDPTTSSPLVARTGEETLFIPYSKTKATFSLPAVAVHTAPVTTHASGEGLGRSKRFSLVLGSKSRIVEEVKDSEHGGVAPYGRSSLDRGATVGRLAELLGRKRS